MADVSEMVERAEQVSHPSRVRWIGVYIGALAVFLSLMFCGAAGLWGLTLYTLAGTTVSVLFCLIMGIPLGIWAAIRDAKASA